MPIKKFRKMLVTANKAERNGQLRIARKIRKDAVTWMKQQGVQA